MNTVFVFGRMTYDATFSIQSTTTTTAAALVKTSTPMKNKIELLAECFTFVFIELTLFEVIHMNLLAILTHTHTVNFSRIYFLHFIVWESEKLHSHT